MSVHVRIFGYYVMKRSSSDYVIGSKHVEKLITINIPDLFHHFQYTGQSSNVCGDNVMLK